MSELIYQFINTIRLTSGRRLYALRRVREVAVNQKMENLLVVVDEAVAVNEQVYSNERAWQRTRELPQARGNAVAIDTAIDRALGGIFKQLGNIAGAMEGTELASRAQALCTRLFPSGLQPVVHQTFEDQLSSNQSILTDLQGDVAGVNELGLSVYVKRLAELVPQFEAEMNSAKQPELSWNQLCAARDLGEVHLRRVIAAILSSGKVTPEDEAVRAKLIAPIQYQLDLTTNSRNAKSGSVDVDPENGDEVPVATPEQQLQGA